MDDVLRCNAAVSAAKKLSPACSRSISELSLTAPLILPKLSLESAFLLQKNLHVLKIKGYRIGLEEIVAEHAREMKAKRGIFGYKKS